MAFSRCSLIDMEKKKKRMNKVCVRAYARIEISLYEKMKFRVGRFSSHCREQSEHWGDLGELHRWFSISSEI